MRFIPHKTRPGRLRQLDLALLALERPLLSRRGGVVVDVGLGAVPVTTIELYQALSALESAPAIVGVDIDPVVLARAMAYSRPGLCFVQSGFDLPNCARPASLIRVMNVLRGYPPAEIPSIHARLGEALADGGLLVEGTSSPTGDVLVAHLLRKSCGALISEGLLFSTDFSCGFAPLLFRDRLPRDLRGYTCDSPVGALFAAWGAAYEDASALARDPRDRFVSCAERLAEQRRIAPLPELWREGVLVWRTTAQRGQETPH